MDVRIRPGTEADLPAALQLIQELATYEKKPDAVTVSLAEMQECGFGPNKLFGFFVAEVNGAVVGLALYYNRYSTWKGRTLHLEDLVVQEAHRRSGIGRLLFQEVAKEAQRQQVGRMEWQVLDWNEPAINFYDSLGTNYEQDWLNCTLSREELKELVDGLD